MTTPSEKPQRRINPLLDDDELPKISEPAQPRVMPSYVERYIKAAEEKRVSAAEDLPPPPQWPMLSGILTFPFQLNVLASWMFISLGLMVFGWLLMFWIAYAAIMGPSGAYYLGLPTCAAGLLTFGYAFTCCLTIIEQTSLGWNTFEVSPGIEWKEWVWNFAHMITLLMQALFVGYVVQLLSASESWLPMFAVSFAVFPIVLLGALAAEGAWVPMAMGKVLKSLIPLGWAWGLFYLEITPMAVCWAWLTIRELGGHTPWLVPLYSGPLLALIILIYARLIGRLGGCISEAIKHSTQGDEDEDE